MMQISEAAAAHTREIDELQAGHDQEVSTPTSTALRTVHHHTVAAVQLQHIVCENSLLIVLVIHHWQLRDAESTHKSRLAESEAARVSAVHSMEEAANAHILQLEASRAEVRRRVYRCLTACSSRLCARTFCHSGCGFNSCRNSFDSYHPGPGDAASNVFDSPGRLGGGQAARDG